VLYALKVEHGRTIQIKRSHAMQNSPEVVRQGINIGGCGAFRANQAWRAVLAAPMLPLAQG